MFVLSDTATKSGGITALYTSDGMVQVVLVAQETPASHLGARDRLTPGRGYTNLVGRVVTHWRRSRGVGSLAFIRVSILVFTHLLIAGVSNWAFTVPART